MIITRNTTVKEILAASPDAVEVFAKHGVDVQVVTGRAPDALSNLAEPDAIFVGGSVSDDGVMRHAIGSLRAGGRLVANAVTIEAQASLTGLYNAYGGALSLLQYAQAMPVGRFAGWRPVMPVVQWRWVKGS